MNISNALRMSAAIAVFGMAPLIVSVAEANSSVADAAAFVTRAAMRDGLADGWAAEEPQR